MTTQSHTFSRRTSAHYAGAAVPAARGLTNGGPTWLQRHCNARTALTGKLAATEQAAQCSGCRLHIEPHPHLATSR
jgi:hypothetical protein